MTTIAEHQDALSRWLKTFTGNRLQPKERQIGFRCCTEFNMPLSRYTPTEISTKQRPEANTDSTRRELETGTSSQHEKCWPPPWESSDPSFGSDPLRQARIQIVNSFNRHAQFLNYTRAVPLNQRHSE